jgi:hypothetical protein
MVVPQSSEQKTCRFGIGVPFLHSGSIAESFMNAFSRAYRASFAKDWLSSTSSINFRTSSSYVAAML